MSDQVAQEALSLNPSAIIDLFEIKDFSSDIGTLYFTSSIKGLNDDGSVIIDPKNITFAGKTYQAIPVQFSGGEVSATGPIAEPMISLFLFGDGENATQSPLLAAMEEADYFHGKPIIHRRTFAKFLGSSSNEDMAQVQKWYINIINFDTGTGIVQFTLRHDISFKRGVVPARKALRNICPFTYRYWENERFIYPDSPCDYRGSKCFDENGNQVSNPSQDVCSHRIDTGASPRGCTNCGAMPGVEKLRA